jgi:hypothetical protein
MIKLFGLFAIQVVWMQQKKIFHCYKTLHKDGFGALELKLREDKLLTN